MEQKWENIVKLGFWDRILASLRILQYGWLSRAAATCCACARLEWDDELLVDDTWEKIRRVHEGCLGGK